MEEAHYKNAYLARHGGVCAYPPPNEDIEATQGDFYSFGKQPSSFENKSHSKPAPQNFQQHDLSWQELFKIRIKNQNNNSYADDSPSGMISYPYLPVDQFLLDERFQPDSFVSLIETEYQAMLSGVFHTYIQEAIQYSNVLNDVHANIDNVIQTIMMAQTLINNAQQQSRHSIVSNSSQRPFNNSNRQSIFMTNVIVNPQQQQPSHDRSNQIPTDNIRRLSETISNNNNNSSSGKEREDGDDDTGQSPLLVDMIVSKNTSATGNTNNAGKTFPAPSASATFSLALQLLSEGLRNFHEHLYQTVLFYFARGGEAHCVACVCACIDQHFKQITNSNNNSNNNENNDSNGKTEQKEQNSSLKSASPLSEKDLLNISQLLVPTGTTRFDATATSSITISSSTPNENNNNNNSYYGRQSANNNSRQPQPYNNNSNNRGTSTFRNYKDSSPAAAVTATTSTTMSTMTAKNETHFFPVSLNALLATIQQLPLPQMPTASSAGSATNNNSQQQNRVIPSFLEGLSPKNAIFLPLSLCYALRKVMAHQLYASTNGKNCSNNNNSTVPYLFQDAVVKQYQRNLLAQQNLMVKGNKGLRGQQQANNIASSQANTSNAITNNGNDQFKSNSFMIKSILKRISGIIHRLVAAKEEKMASVHQNNNNNNNNNHNQKSSPSGGTPVVASVTSASGNGVSTNNSNSINVACAAIGDEIKSLVETSNKLSCYRTIIGEKDNATKRRREDDDRDNNKQEVSSSTSSSDTDSTSDGDIHNTNNYSPKQSKRKRVPSSSPSSASPHSFSTRQLQSTLRMSFVVPPSPPPPPALSSTGDGVNPAPPSLTRGYSYSSSSPSPLNNYNNNNNNNNHVSFNSSFANNFSNPTIPTSKKQIQQLQQQHQQVQQDARYAKDVLRKNMNVEYELLSEEKAKATLEIVECLCEMQSVLVSRAERDAVSLVVSHLSRRLDSLVVQDPKQWREGYVFHNLVSNSTKGSHLIGARSRGRGEGGSGGGSANQEDYLFSAHGAIFGSGNDGDDDDDHHVADETEVLDKLSSRYVLRPYTKYFPASSPSFPLQQQKHQEVQANTNSTAKACSPLHRIQQSALIQRSVMFSLVVDDLLRQVVPNRPMPPGQQQEFAYCLAAVRLALRSILVDGDIEQCPELKVFLKVVVGVNNQTQSQGDNGSYHTNHINFGKQQQHQQTFSSTTTTTTGSLTNSSPQQQQIQSANPYSSLTNVFEDNNNNNIFFKQANENNTTTKSNSSNNNNPSTVISGPTSIAAVIPFLLRNKNIPFFLTGGASVPCRWVNRKQKKRDNDKSKNNNCKVPLPPRASIVPSPPPSSTPARKSRLTRLGVPSSTSTGLDRRTCSRQKWSQESEELEGFVNEVAPMIARIRYFNKNNNNNETADGAGGATESGRTFGEVAEKFFATRQVVSTPCATNSSTIHTRASAQLTAKCARSLFTAWSLVTCSGEFGGVFYQHQQEQLTVNKPKRRTGRKLDDEGADPDEDQLIKLLKLIKQMERKEMTESGVMIHEENDDDGEEEEDGEEECEEETEQDQNQEETVTISVPNSQRRRGANSSTMTAETSVATGSQRFISVINTNHASVPAAALNPFLHLIAEKCNSDKNWISRMVSLMQERWRRTQIHIRLAPSWDISAPKMMVPSPPPASSAALVPITVVETAQQRQGRPGRASSFDKTQVATNDDSSLPSSLLLKSNEVQQLAELVAKEALTEIAPASMRDATDLQQKRNKALSEMRSALKKRYVSTSGSRR